MISPHISEKEATVSATGSRLGIKNNPNPAILATMKITARKLFEPLRTGIGKPIRIISFYRSPALNKAVGGSKTSQHMTGEAIDAQGMEGVSNLQLFNYIKDNLDFDQLINEFPDKDGEPSWVHLSYTVKRPNRKEIIRARKVKGKTIYEPYQ